MGQSSIRHLYINFYLLSKKPSYEHIVYIVVYICLIFKLDVFVIVQLVVLT